MIFCFIHKEFYFQDVEKSNVDRVCSFMNRLTDKQLLGDLPCEFKFKNTRVVPSGQS